ncbi:MAG: hypothetical protein K6E85_08330 [Lachnospiraceae bacterium]|nr:hypothetical protein [Lachnospiraceae bacterium]
MSIASASRLRNEMCFCIICIDGHDNEDISGRIFNAYYRDAIEFDNTMEMIAKLEDIFNIFGYPHQTMDLRRSFSKEHEHDGEDGKGKSNGRNSKEGKGNHSKTGSDSDDMNDNKSASANKYEGVIMIGPRPDGSGKVGRIYDQDSINKNGINSGNGNGIVMGRRLHVAPTMHLIKHNAKGRLATLKTRVMFRQNAEWQGNARWLEEDLTEDFSSVIELMMLIDSMF